MSTLRLIMLVAASVLGACATVEPTIVSQTPASVEIECVGVLSSCRSAQAVADLAQRHCHQFGLDAQESKVAVAPSGNRVAIYNCVGQQH